MPNPPCIPTCYTLTKIHKQTPVGSLIISGCDYPTEKLSSFVDTILQPIATSQKSYLKDNRFYQLYRREKIPEETILVSMDVTSPYTNIPQEEVQTKRLINIQWSRVGLSNYLFTAQIKQAAPILSTKKKHNALISI